MLIQRFIRVIYFVGYKVVKVYWCLAKPKHFGVKCVVRCGEDVLLIRNSYGLVGWTFPGGGIHKSEAPEQAARREVQEEVGLVVGDLMPIGTFITTVEWKTDTIQVFVATVDKKDVAVDNIEVVAAEWAPVDTMPMLNEVGKQVYLLYKDYVHSRRNN